MVRSKTTIPHAWQTQEADVSGVVANRTANKAAFQAQEGFSLTYLPYVMAATISALREHPEVTGGLLAVGASVISNASYYLLLYIPTYGVKQLHLHASTLFIATLVGGAVLAVFSVVAGHWSDKVSRT